MKRVFFWFVALGFLSATVLQAQIPTISSPNKSFKAEVWLNENGVLTYSLSFKNQAVVKASKLGFVLSYQEKTNFFSDFELVKADTSSSFSTWKPVLGEESEITDNHHELYVEVKQKETGRVLGVRFRLFDDGLGFRYEFPAQKNLSFFVISDELTEFALTGDHQTFWIPGDYDSNEYAYSKTPLSQIKAQTAHPYNNLAYRLVSNDSLIQTPALMKTDKGLYMLIFEAGVRNFPVMFADVDRSKFVYKAHLVPDPSGNKARVQTPDVTPWRTIHVSEKAETLLSSRMTLNLNEPSKIEDTSWIKPMKYVGIWWGMHVGVYSWNYTDTNTVKLGITDWNSLKPHGRHGATTERVISFIDFAAKHGFDGVLVEGWNVGWEGWSGPFKEWIFDFVTPYPDFDIEYISKYAKEKGVKMIMHHETAAGVVTYERQLQDAMDVMVQYGYPAVKTGYVGTLSPIGEHHDGQTMSEHYYWVAQEMAKHQLMVNMHESHRLSGVHRTYPNWIASEAARGNEFNAWSAGNPPEHETILPFTRLMGGPMDYTPGIFEIKLSHYNPDNKYSVKTTLVKQLALYVTMYSPLQMAADLPENYERYADAFQFIKDVGVDWSESKVIAAEPGDYIVIARKEKGTEEWFLGGITDEEKREFTVKLDFLTDKQNYMAEIYQDGKDAHWDKNPKSYEIKKQKVTSKSKLKLKLAEGGGVAIRYYPINK
ncbi:glycoside hydrolase family 97 protein [bacterium]|nr:MAG: glycoside hydrolase family 97 protein [bacterium]